MDLNQLLAPPGHGVFTVHAAKDRKDKLDHLIYGNHDPKESWLKSLRTIPSSKILLFGIPSDNGGGIHRGANWGPLVARECLLKESTQTFLDLGDIRVIPHYLSDSLLSKKAIESSRLALYGNKKSKLPVAPLDMSKELMKKVRALNPFAKVMMIGGDHSVSFPVIKEWLESRRKKKIKTAVIHFDAHTDLLESRLGVDVCFGTWTYHLLPFLESPQHLIQMGIRSSGKPKSFWEKKYGIHQWWATDLKKWGINKTIGKLKKILTSLKVDEIYITFDFDALDERFAATTGTPEADGLEPHEAVLLINALGDFKPVTGVDLVEFAPFIQFKSGLEKVSYDSIGIMARTLLSQLHKHEKD
jgi:agmatinase